MTAPRPAIEDTPMPIDPGPATHRTADPRQMARHRAALRAEPAPAAAPEPSAIYPFVLAHPVAESAVRRMAENGGEPPHVVHLSQEIRIRRLPRPHERIGTALQVLGVRTQPRGSTVAVAITLSGEGGEDGEGAQGGGPVGELVSTVLLSGTSLEAFGEVPRPAAPVRGDPGEAAVLTHSLSAEWIARYAEAADDRNPIHLDPAAARAAGFGTVIAHGMGVAGLVCEEIVDRFAGGSPARVLSIGARFSAPVEAGEPVETTLQPDAGARVIGFSCRTAAGLAIKGGRVELAGPRGAAEREADA
ncbi:hypothetical protein GCM10027570_08220 [Streptomonospora sediminis]